MIEKLLNKLGYVKKSSLLQETKSDVSEIETKPVYKYGCKCRSCGRPAYNDRNRGLCYMCDPGILD